MLLVVPKEYVPRVMEKVQEEHQGVNKTFAELCERFYWVDCLENAEKRCRKFATCATTKVPSTTKQHYVG